MPKYVIAVTEDAIVVASATRPIVDERDDHPVARSLMAGETRVVDPVFSVLTLIGLTRTTPYLEVADRVSQLLETPPLSDHPGRAAYKIDDWQGPRPYVLVDVTGAARPVLDVLRDRRVFPAIGVALVGTGGSDVAAADVRVSEREPIARLATLMHRARIRLAAKDDGAEAIRTALLSASVASSNSGPVLAIAIAVWFAECGTRSVFARIDPRTGETTPA